MARQFSAARLRRSASFSRLTGISVAVFDTMLAQLRGSWDAEQAGKPSPAVPERWGGRKITSWSCRFITAAISLRSSLASSMT